MKKNLTLLSALVIAFTCHSPEADVLGPEHMNEDSDDFGGARIMTDRAKKQFIQLDADGDHVISRNEANAGESIEIPLTEFIRVDTNHDGVLTPREFLAASPKPKFGGLSERIN